MVVVQPQLLVLKYLDKDGLKMNKRFVKPEKHNRRAKKPALILAILLLIITVFFTVNLISKGFNGKEDLAYKNNKVFIYKEHKNIEFDIAYTNDKSLNKALEKNVESIFNANSEIFLNKDKKISVKLSLNNDKNLASWLFIEETDNFSEVYGSLVFNTKNDEVITYEKILGEDLKGLSMLVRESLAKEEGLLYNRNTYTKTVPEPDNFKYIMLDKDKFSILFKRDTFDLDKVFEAKLDYEAVMPYLSDQFLKFFDKDYIKPDIANVRYIDPHKPMVAMTFDDGPNYPKTVELGEHFAKHNARVTYFVLGSRMDADSETVLDMHNLGHEIANHSYDHQNYNKIDDAELKRQTTDVSDKIKALTKQEVVLIRPPFGSSNESVRAKIESPLILWRVDPLDWKFRDSAVVYENIKNDIYDGAIILSHDLYQTTVDASKKVLDNFSNQYQFLTVSEMFAYKGVPLNNGELYFEAKGR